MLVMKSKITSTSQCEHAVPTAVDAISSACQSPWWKLSYLASKIKHTNQIQPNWNTQPLTCTTPLLRTIRPSFVAMSAANQCDVSHDSDARDQLTLHAIRHKSSPPRSDLNPNAHTHSDTTSNCNSYLQPSYHPIHLFTSSQFSFFNFWLNISGKARKPLTCR